MRDEMDALVSAAARVTDADVEALDLRSAEADLLEEIMSTPILESVDGEARTPRRQSRTGRRLLTMAAAAAVAASALFVVQSTSDTDPVWAAEVLEVAEAAPRLLIDDSDWQIGSADQFSAEAGTMIFTDGTRQFQLNWMRTTEAGAGDPENADAEQAVTVLGRDATLRRYEPTPGPRAEADLDPLYDSTMYSTTWEHSGHRIVASGWAFATQRDYEAVLSAIREVDVDTWLTAMPASVVRPADVDAVVADMMAGVPAPVGFDAAAIVADTGVQDRGQLSFRISGAVTCAWLGQWVDATRAGDDDAAAGAADALATSRDWPILRNLALETGREPLTWTYADAVANGGALPDGSTVGEVLPAGSIEGDTVLVEPVEIYKIELGCDW